MHQIRKYASIRCAQTNAVTILRVVSSEKVSEHSLCFCSSALSLQCAKMVSLVSSLKERESRLQNKVLLYRLVNLDELV